MGLVVWLCELVGVENVDPGSWPGPVYFNGSEEQASLLKELFFLEFGGGENPYRIEFKKVGPT